VGPGNVLKDLIACGLFPVTYLKKIFRQGAGSQIAMNAQRINQGKMPYLNRQWDEGDFLFVEGETQEVILQQVTDLVEHTLPQKGFCPEDIQVLCPMRKGMIGIENLNRLLQMKLNPSSHPLLRFGKAFHMHDKVMQLRNNYQKDVFNGDIGKIMDIHHEEQSVTVCFDGREVHYDFSELDELDLAYAVSIHKYQGSESPCIILPIHTSHFMMLHRNLLYTGITRGKKRVIVVGTLKAIGIAVHHTNIQKRHTHLEKSLKTF